MALLLLSLGPVVSERAYPRCAIRVFMSLAVASGSYNSAASRKLGNRHSPHIMLWCVALPVRLCCGSPGCASLLVAGRCR